MVVPEQNQGCPAREGPILFAAPSVRGILAGAKTQTRRLATGGALQWLAIHGKGQASIPDPGLGASPFGHAGDRLWVRETFAYRGNEDGHLTRPDGSLTDNVHEAGLLFRADTAPGPYGAEVTRNGEHFFGPWRPAIFLPRWASRIALQVEAVRLERLQAITDTDIEAEAIGYHPAANALMSGMWTWRAAFEAGWDAINGKRGPWAANPWVWAITFRRLL